MPQKQTRIRGNPIEGRDLTMRRSVNDVERRDIKCGRGPAIIQTRCGFVPITYSDGWLNETKQMIAKAYEVWRKKRRVPKYDHFGCAGIKF